MVLSTLERSSVIESIPLSTIELVSSAILAICSEFSDTILIFSDRLSICLKHSSESSACCTTPCSISSIAIVISLVPDNSSFALIVTVSIESSTFLERIWVLSISLLTLPIIPLVLFAKDANSSLPLTSIAIVRSPLAAVSRCFTIFLVALPILPARNITIRIATTKDTKIKPRDMYLIVLA